MEKSVLKTTALFTETAIAICLALANLRRYGLLQPVASVSAVLVLTALFIFACYSLLRGKVGLLRGVIIGLCVLDIFLMLLYIAKKYGLWKVFENVEALLPFLRSFGVYTPICYVLLHFLQVIVLPIPTALTVMAGVAIFGAWYAVLYSLIGVVAGSLVAYWVGRKAGVRAVCWIIGKQKTRTVLKKLQGKNSTLLSLLFFIPFMPDDILCFVSGLSYMPPVQFVITVLFSRVVSVGISALSVRFVPLNTWWGVLIWAIVFFGLAVSFVGLLRNAEGLEQRLAAYVRNKKAKRNQVGP